jgi:glycosyltransferase involved in cell wall biosynthesis
MAIKYSVILPAYNEAESIGRAIGKVAGALKGLPAEVIVAEDGSRDGTFQAAKKAARGFSNVRVFHFEGRLGRGGALINAFSKAKGEFVAYIDTDLSPDPKALRELFTALEGCDVVTGSRYAPGAKAKRELSRLTASSVFNFLVQIVLGSGLRDHQCGLKAFKKPVILEICKRVKSRGWFWDTEVLVLAQKMGYRTAEVPIAWSEERFAGQSKVNFLRDSLRMFADIVAMRLRLWKRGILY